MCQMTGSRPAPVFIRRPRDLFSLFPFSDLLYSHDFVSLWLTVYSWYSFFLTLTRFSPSRVQMLNSSWSPFPYHPPFKQVLMFEGGKSSFPKQDQSNPIFMEGPMNSLNSSSNYQVSLASTEDNIPIMDPRLLPGIATFKQLYLIAKILGEMLPIKLIIAKCLTEWKPTSDVE